MRRSKRPGFTLVELLVVITVIALLMAMIFPAFNKVVARARQASCLNNIKELTKSVAAYIVRNEEYPGYLNELRKPKGQDRGMPGTWVVEILNDLNETDAGDSWRDPNDVQKATPRIKALICPSDDATEYNQAISYVGNCGFSKDIPNRPIPPVRPGGTQPQGPKKGNGVFYDRYDFPGVVVRPSDIDSNNHCLLFTENIQAWQWADARVEEASPQSFDAKGAAVYTGFVWGEGRSINQDYNNKLYRKFVPQLTQAIRYARPSSYHSGGVNVSFCSGAAGFLAVSIDDTVMDRITVSNPNKGFCDLRNAKRIEVDIPGF